MNEARAALAQSQRHIASLLLQDGASPAYVQEQLGHASILETTRPYGAGSGSRLRVLSTGSLVAKR